MWCHKGKWNSLPHAPGQVFLPWVGRLLQVFSPGDDVMAVCQVRSLEASASRWRTANTRRRSRSSWWRCGQSVSPPSRRRSCAFSQVPSQFLSLILTKVSVRSAWLILHFWKYESQFFFCQYLYIPIFVSVFLWFLKHFDNVWCFQLQHNIMILL